MLDRVTGPSPMRVARIAGAVYLLVFAAGIAALVVRGTAGAAYGLVAGALYVVVTLLFYDLFKPASRPVSLIAALVSLTGIVVGPLRLLSVNPLVFFGVYCLLIAFLIVRSKLVPRFLGVLMAVAGLGWLTFASPALAKELFPYNLAPGIVGEGTLTLWLLVRGVNIANSARLNESSAAAKTSGRRPGRHSPLAS